MVGRSLKEKREDLGITLEEVASQTQIKLEFLESLEEETYHHLPDPSYLTGFLRRYATFLGLDADSVVKAFQEQISRPLMARFEPIARESPSARARRRWRRPVLWGAAVILAAVVCFLIAYFVSHGIGSRSGRPPVVEEERGETSGRTGTPNPAPAAEQSSTPHPAKGHTLSIHAAEKTWLVVQSDDEPPREMLLMEGEVLSLSCQRQFLLTLGNAGGVEMLLDGRRLPSPGSQGQVVRDLILPAKPGG